MTDAVVSCECEGTGWVMVATEGVRRVQRCHCWKDRQATSAPGVPIEFAPVSLDDGEYHETKHNKHALAYARKFLELVEARDCYVFGPVGSGKTRLACAMLNEFFRLRRSGYFARVPMLLMRLQPSDVEHSDLFWRCCETPLLVLDDLGAERDVASDFTRRTLLMLYEERGDRGLRTIWTSNKSLAEIGDFMQDERLASRIMGRSDVLELGGDDWRVTRRRR